MQCDSQLRPSEFESSEAIGCDEGTNCRLAIRVARSRSPERRKHAAHVCLGSRRDSLPSHGFAYLGTKTSRIRCSDCRATADRRAQILLSEAQAAPRY